MTAMVPLAARVVFSGRYRCVSLFFSGARAREGAGASTSSALAAKKTPRIARQRYEARTGAAAAVFKLFRAFVGMNKQPIAII